MVNLAANHPIAPGRHGKGT